MSLWQTCNGGDRATRLRRRHYTPTVAALPQDDPDEMDELANEVAPDRPTSPPVRRKTASARLAHCAASTTRRTARPDRKKGTEANQLLPPNV